MVFIKNEGTLLAKAGRSLSNARAPESEVTTGLSKVRCSRLGSSTS